MHIGKYVFSQIVDFLKMTSFNKLVKKNTMVTTEFMDLLVITSFGIYCLDNFKTLKY